jgi:hypothetical protein
MVDHHYLVAGIKGFEGASEAESVIFSMQQRCE